GWERPKRGEIQTVEGTLIDFEVSLQAAFEPRQGLRAECLQNPKGIWNAALAYTLSNSRHGEDRARKWAYGIWAGIYPGSKLPYGLYDAVCEPANVEPDEWSLLDREVKRCRKNGKRRAAA